MARREDSDGIPDHDFHEQRFRVRVGTEDPQEGGRVMTAYRVGPRGESQPVSRVDDPLVPELPSVEEVR